MLPQATGVSPATTQRSNPNATNAEASYSSPAANTCVPAKRSMMNLLADLNGTLESVERCIVDAVLSGVDVTRELAAAHHALTEAYNVLDEENVRDHR